MFRLRSALARSFPVLVAVLCVCSAVLAQTPSGNVVISADTTWPTANYSVTSLTVQSGAVLTVGGGSTVTVANGITVTEASSIVLQSINNTAQVNGAWAGAGVTLQAASVQVDGGSSINADAQGYTTDAGPGDVGAGGGSGGTYGGQGGYSPGPIYGSPTMPVDLGSGGRSAQYGGSTGGGAIRLIVSGTLTNNGTISANGQAVLPSQRGAGAGGSVYVTTATLAGSGSFTANGGSNTTPNLSGSAAGGGGRVAVSYSGPTSFTGFGASTASGGVYTGTTAGYAGSNGSSVFINTSGTNGGLAIYQSFSLPANSTFNYDSISVQNGAVLTIGGGSTLTVANGVTVTGNSSIVMQSANNTALVNGAWAGVGVTLKAASLQVDAGSSITADGQGYGSDAGPGDVGAGGASGGTYGGQGGATPGPIYGSASMPVDLGSGGRSAQYGGSNGGGAIRLIVSGKLTNNGSISANGLAVMPGLGGAGAGGSVYVTTTTLAGSGSFVANGGSNTTPTQSGAAAGGGGRVAIYYSGPTTFTGFKTSTASGGVFTGTTAGYAGMNGTAVFVDTSAQNGNVSVYQSGFQIPANANVQYNSLTIANGAAVSVGSGSTLAVATNLSVGSGSVLTIAGGDTLTVGAGITVTGNSSIVLQSANNSAQVNGAWAGVGVTLHAGSVQVDAGSSINADGQGYITDDGPGDASANGGSGGSYGGSGGYTPGPTYGSAAMPVDLGSGGRSAQYGGSNGGGAIRLIVSGKLTNNGSISATGQAVQPSGGGAGAGGSVYVTTATLAGSGSFSANGGSNMTPQLSGSAAGGGGRVAVYYADPTTFTGFAASTASGGVFTGTTVGYAGTDGTSAFFDTSAQNNNASIYQHYEVPANTSLQYNSLNVAKGASVTLGGGSQVSVTQKLQVTGTITVLATNNAAEVNGMWLGKGVVIAAGSMQIDATGSINADAQGYPANAGPGAGGYTTGGSYGGAGGGQPTTSTYGSKLAPIDLGSGGGSGQNTGGGTGGGAIELLISGALTNNGAISANGGSIANSGYGGAGAGGSVYIQTNGLQGSGTFAASGGSNTSPNNAGGGGGGGRISINYVTNSGVVQTALSVNAGTAATPGAPGTINFVQAIGLQFLKPTNSAVHDVVALEWSSTSGTSTTVNAAGPQSSVIATGGTGISNATWNTIGTPDGAYELRLTASDASGIIASVSKNVVVNNSVTWVSGTLSANTHWTANHVYAIEGDLIIPSGVTLTIDPGTVVKSLANFQIVVQSGGTLTALGGASNPVIFTTFDDSSVGGNTDFGASIPQPGEWGGINVQAGGTLNSNTDTFVRYGHGALGSTITSNTTLMSSQAYEIAGTLTVSSGVTLTVQPGAIIKFDQGAGITVNQGGAIVANGTLAQPIYFTSINDQSVGANLVLIANPAAVLTPPAPGDWNSININGSASFNFVHILYGGGPIPTAGQEGMLESGSGARITLANSTLAYSYYIGIQTGLTGTGDTYTITNSTFYNNQERALNVYPGTSVHIVNCTFDGNASGPFNHGGAMDIENSVVTGFFNTQFGGVGGPLGTFRNNDVYTATPGVPNYAFGAVDPTGTNGNISVNPVYMNGPQHDYRPTYGSPLIDAANGTVPNYPLTDSFGDPRYNAPLVTTKTGTPDASGKYPDIGAFEFVQSAPSDLDLTVSEVQGPASALVGTHAQISWTITNVGAGTVYGPWHDAIYLVRDPGTNPVETYAGQVLSGQGIILGPGATYKGTAAITVPGAVAGEHSWEVKTNVLGEIFEGANTANNKAVSLNPVQIDLPELTAGTGRISGSFATPGQPVYYKILPSTTQTTRIQLALLPPAMGSVQLFIGAGYVPSPQHYDYQQEEFNSATATVVIPSGSAQTYYITAFPQVLASSPTSYTIVATTVSFSLTSVSPSSAAATGSATLTFVGGGFTSHTVFSLVGSTGTAYTPTATYLFDSDNAVLTFDLSKIPAGTYTPEAVDGSTVTLANAFTVLKYDATSANISNNPQVELSLDTPTAFRKGFPSLVTLNYRSLANSDIPAPIMYLSADNATLSAIQPECDGCDPNLAIKLANTFNDGLFLGINQQGPAGVLPAGASGSLQFLATPLSGGTVTFSSGASPVDPVSTAYDSNVCRPYAGYSTVLCNASRQTGAYASAAGFCDTLAPAGISSTGFDRACMQMLNNASYRYTPFIILDYSFPPSGTPPADGFVGPYVSLANWNRLLADDATALSASGSYEFDLQKLIAFELQKDGLTELSARYHQGAYGYGPSHPFDITFSNSAGGTPMLTYPDGSTRAFATPASGQMNTYLGAAGDYGVIAMQNDSSWLLTEPGGTLYDFFPLTGNTSFLNYIQDRAGNRVNLTYVGNQLTSVVDGFGNTATMEYDPYGHMTSLTDPAGRVTTYTYHTYPFTRGYLPFTSAFLETVTDNTGTTTFTWMHEGAEPSVYLVDKCITTFCQPAIGVTAIAYPDGTHKYFTYDTVGRVTGISRDGGAEAISFTYNKDGSTTTTDALGKSSTSVPNVNGLPTSITDPFGNTVRFRYNAENKLVTSLGPLGDSASTGYDSKGNLSNITSPLGNTTSLSFGGQQSLLSITDPNGNTSGFSYDGNYDAIAETYSNSTQDQSTYDTQGHVVTRTNRRGKTTTFTYTSNGLIASKTFADGSQVLFAYDGHRNLQSVTTSAGATRYTYDSADRLLSLTNPDGTFLQYTYNAGGQRTRMTDSTGFATNYTYDSAGRLATLKNTAGQLIVSYTYDANGKLAAKKLGNGTSASYAYDTRGNLSSIVNHTAANAVQSEYDYTYDAESNPVSLAGPGGTATFAYDLEGQLVSATSPSSTVEYTYDAAGNRTQATSNGTVRTFDTNNLNQYTTAGTSSYQYDADGNLIAGDGWTYGYDDENHLVSMVKGSDSWSFQYDGLSHRIASVHNGVATHYLIDSKGFENIATEFNSSGQPTVHYTYGIDLTSAVQASGTTSYYHFDGSGNTTQMTSASGAVFNSYTYQPFGEATVLAASVNNPFTYNGRLGVRDEGAGVYYMRNRWYNPSLGHFLQMDPLNLADGTNAYRYADNSPIKKTDPLGLLPGPPDYYELDGSLFVSLSVSVNAHTGEVFVGYGFTGGVGANVSGGKLINVPASANLGAATADFQGGSSSSVAAYAYGGGGVTTSLSSGQTAVVGGLGFGGKGGGVNYDSVSTNSTFVQHVFSDANNFTGGALFGTDPTSPFGPRIPAPPLPGVQPIIPCRGCLFTPGGTHPVPVNGSIDPNGKLTSGYGDQGFIPAGAPITYTIYFENQPTATLPAQKVVVTDTLAANLDWSTVQLNQVNFNNVSLQIPDGTQTYRSQASVSTDSNPVSVVASLSPTTGTITWTLQSVSPTTGGAPDNPLAGFLPPNGSSNAGIGSVVFTVQPKSGLSNGTAITNQGSIVFDANAAIATNTVTNTVDSSTVTSAIAPLPATTLATASSSFPVSWSGTDSGGSGIASYNIYVAVDAGPYTLWLSGTTLTTAYFTSGFAGHSYSFISLAANNVGIAQTTPAAAQTTAVILQTPVVKLMPASGASLTTQPLSVTVTVTGNGTPTGTVTLTIGAYTSAATTLTSGTATIVIPAGTLTLGTDTITATYTPDPQGNLVFMAATGSTTIAVQPSTVQVTVGTAPAGLGFSVDGTSYTSTQSLTWTIGSSHTIATNSPQTSAGVQQTFSAWSDGGAITHTVTAATSAAYTASFNTAYLLTLASSPTAGGTVTPATGTYYPAGTMVNLTATPTAGYTFNNWTGAVASSTSAATTITLNAAQTATANFTLIPLVPMASLSPGSLTFTATSGSTSAAQTVKLANTGTGPLSITAITLGGSGASAFAQTNTCGSSLAPGANCSVAVTFAPTSVATFTASLSVASNATGAASTVTLSGTSTAPASFTLGATPASQTISQGSTATYMVTLTPQGGAFTSAITLTAAGLPSGATFTFAPPTVTPGSSAATSKLIVQTSSTSANNLPLPGGSAAVPILAAFGCLLVVTRKRRKLLRGVIMTLALIYIIPALSGCAGSPHPTAETSTITITATSGAQTQTSSVSLTIQ